MVNSLDIGIGCVYNERTRQASHLRLDEDVFLYAHQPHQRRVVYMISVVGTRSARRSGSPGQAGRTWGAS